MKQSSPKDLSNNCNIQPDCVSPPSKRRCSAFTSKICLPNQPSCVLVDLTSNDIVEHKDECKSCGKQETLLRTFNCPSLHCFCLNCIFNWTQKHVQSKTPPICLATTCDYLLKNEDLDDLPIGIKDHQILLQLIELKRNKTNLRVKCDKCDLYIDQHNLYIHKKECQGRSLTIPCEICFCPVLIEDYEQHMLICTNDNNFTLIQFLLKHIQNPNLDEKTIRFFVCAWQRKHRNAIDIYEIIEQCDQTSSSEEICDRCKKTVRSDDFYSINCSASHSLCILCYKQHVQNQMSNNQILTCHQCAYHLQDKDLSDIRVFSNEQTDFFQNYQNRKVLKTYSDLFSGEDPIDVNPPIPRSNETTSNADDTARCKCELCLKQHFYVDIFVLNCNCKLCYDCFANEVRRQQTTTNDILTCAFCRTPIQHNDLSNLRLPPVEIRTMQLHQQGKLFEQEHAVHFIKPKTNQTIDINDDDVHDNDDFDMTLLSQQESLPKYWTLPMLTNFSRHILDPQSTEYKFVADKFNKSWMNLRNQGPPPNPTVPSRPPPMAIQAPPPKTSVPPQILYNSQAFYLPLGSLQASPTMHTPINSNPSFVVPPNVNLGPPSYAVAPGMNTMTPSTGIPFSSQQMHRSIIPSGHARPPNPPPMHYPVAPVRRSRPVQHTNNIPSIAQIERVQNQRWYKQYSAHEHEFRHKFGKQTEQWLFHGCDEKSSKNIELECFNRSYAGQHAAAYGQGCYFARDSLYSHNYALPDRTGVRRMFLARVLVGKTVLGNSTMRVPPPGCDTTGDGLNIFVTYHDSQAYAEYLVTYR